MWSMKMCGVYSTGDRESNRYGQIVKIYNCA